MGEKLAQSIAGFFNDKENLRTLDALKTLGIRIANPEYVSGEQKVKGSLDGLTIVITGTLSKPRNEIEELIEKQGGRASGSVSKKTSFVLAGDEPGKNKIDKAKELGITIIDEAQFMKLSGSR